MAVSETKVEAGRRDARAQPRAVTQADGKSSARRPMRVLHLIDVETENYFLNNLLKYSDPREVEYLAVTLGRTGGFTQGLAALGAKAYALNMSAHPYHPQTMARLWRIVREERIEIVHTHLFAPTLLGVTLARLSGRKVVVTRHHSDALHQLTNPLKRRLYLSLEHYINRQAHHLIAPSRRVREILVEREGVAPEKVSLIPYGQTAERFDAVTPAQIARVRAELGMDGRLALVCTARLYHRKGHVYLFEALAPLIAAGWQATLYLVGAGTERERLAQLAQQQGLAECVRFLGWRDDALAIMAAADLVVQPSLEDALSSALIEALMLERPIIATDISGVRDTLADGRFGVIVPPADAAALRQALRTMAAGLEAARESARLGRRYLLDYMHAGRVAAQHLACYQQLRAA